jgi:signal transduction histidine kinase
MVDLGTGRPPSHCARQDARASSDQTAVDGLVSTGKELQEAAAELRELAAAIRPALLTERGLGPALAALAERSPVPVRLAAPCERQPAASETAIYSVCSEALANVANTPGQRAQTSRCSWKGTW